jgi:hypothetical protein
MPVQWAQAHIGKGLPAAAMAAGTGTGTAGAAGAKIATAATGVWNGGGEMQ